jgi:cytidyltransferase-like protein
VSLTLLTIGTFDVPHMGHASFLRRCESFTDLGHIVVGVNSDAFVMTYKGETSVFTQAERMGLIRELGYRVRINDGPGRELIQAVEPDIIAIGTDWAKRDYHAQIDTPVDYFEERSIAMLYIPYTLGISTTDLKTRLSSA